nr:hypothetical protein Iba_chr06eCG0070 [Ipomoea batatas]
MMVLKKPISEPSRFTSQQPQLNSLAQLVKNSDQTRLEGSEVHVPSTPRLFLVPESRPERDRRLNIFGRERISSQARSGLELGSTGDGPLLEEDTRGFTATRGIKGGDERLSGIPASP